MCCSIDGGLPFLHHLKKGGLRLGWGTVHLVDQYHIGKDGAGMKLELLRLHVEHAGSQHVAGHEVGRELHTAELGVDKPRYEFGQQRLGYAGHPLYQHMASGKNGCQ